MSSSAEGTNMSSDDERSTGAVHILMPESLHHDYQGLTLRSIHDQLCKRIRALPVKQAAYATQLIEICRNDALKDEATLRSREPTVPRNDVAGAPEPPLMPVPKTK